MTMRRLRVLGLWLVFQIPSTSQHALSDTNLDTNTYKNATSDVLPSPSVLKSFNQQLAVYGSTSITMGYTDNVNLLASDIYSLMLASDVTSERTQSKFRRNSYRNAQSESVRSSFTWTIDVRSASSTENAFIARPTRTTADNSTEINYPNLSTLDERNLSTLMTLDSKNVQNTTAFRYSFQSLNFSSSQAKSSSILKSHHATNTSQSSITRTMSSKAEISRGILHSKTMVISVSRSYDRIESSSHNRFPRSSQTLSSSRIINATLSNASVSKTQQLVLNKTRISSFTVTNYITFQISTLRSLEPSQTLDSVNLSSYRNSTFSEHGKKSFLTKTQNLTSSTTGNKVPNGTIQAIKWVMTKSKEMWQTSTNKESTNKLESRSRSKVFLSASFSFERKVVSTIFKTQTSEDKSRIRTSNGVMVPTVHFTDNKSHEISTIVYKLSTIITTTHHQPAGQAPSMPFYVLAICLPLALLVGFAIALVYFKRNKEDQRVQYSVTVEIASENPDYELKRMYSIIDISAGINQDSFSELESKKCSSTMLDQLDTVSVNISQPDQTV